MVYLFDVLNDMKYRGKIVKLIMHMFDQFNYHNYGGVSGAGGVRFGMVWYVTIALKRANLCRDAILGVHLQYSDSVEIRMSQMSVSRNPFTNMD